MNSSRSQFASEVQGGGPLGVPVAAGVCFNHARYDCYTGLLKSVTNPHGLVQTTFYDAVNRVTKITSGSSRTTQYTYNDSARWILKRQSVLAANDGKSVTIAKFDQLGRPTETRQLETNIANDITAAASSDGIVTNYRYLTTSTSGIEATVISNPSGGTGGSATGWSANFTDKVGRPCAMEKYSAEPSLSGSTDYCGTTTSSINGRSETKYALTTTPSFRRKTTTKDAAGVQKELLTDSLGRLREVVEDPAVKNYKTEYQYDTLDNLTRVKQGSLPDRVFDYSSLSRLLSADNPESGVTQYAYDDAGNLKSKKDVGRSITTCFGLWDAASSACSASVAGYDTANRLVKKSYSDGTPTIDWVYDKERLQSVTNNVATISYSHDELNRVTSRKTAFAGVEGVSEVGYTYYPAGVSKMTYPSTKALQYGYL